MKFRMPFKALRVALQIAPLITVALLVSNFRELPKSDPQPAAIDTHFMLTPTPGWLTASDGTDPFALAPHAADPVYTGTYLSIISPYVANTR